MSSERRKKRAAVRRLAESVKKAKETEFNIQLPKSSWEYFKKQVKK